MVARVSGAAIPLDQNHLILTGLGAGEHQVSIVAWGANWASSEALEFTVHILKPLWQRAWFVVTFIAGLGSVIWLTVVLVSRRRIARFTAEIEQQAAVTSALNNERRRLASEMHDDLGSGLNAIRILASKLRVQLPAHQEPEIRRIEDYTGHMMDNMREIVWSIDESSTSVSDVLYYIRHFVKQAFADAGIPSDISVSIAQEVALSARIRRNFFLIVKEAVTNVIKHSDPSLVKITLRAHESLEFICENDGAQTSNHTVGGNGVSNMCWRAKDLKGSLHNCTKGNSYRLECQIPIITQQ